MRHAAAQIGDAGNRARPDGAFRRARGIRFASAGLALALAGCRSPLPDPAAEPSGACHQLARTFRDAAEKRDRGVSRESQIAAAHAAAADPATADPSGTLRYLLRTVEFVYGRPDATPEGIEAQVLAGCLVNSEGRAVLYLPDP